jgi:deleted-in-malignant-brain-tumors protein 1
LVNGTSDMEGRIEICFDEAWGTICDNLWTTNDGNVACQQLGFSQFGLF